MQGTKTTSYLLKTSAGCKRVTRRIGKRRKTVKRVGERLVAPIMLAFTLVAGIYAQLQVESPLIDPKAVWNVQKVQAIEIVEETTKTEPTIEEYILEVFGTQLAVDIATCESGLNPEAHGDKHLLGELDGEMVGDSIGLFQVRTGDAGVYDSKPWSRAKANGMTADEFRAEMKDPYKNIDYAYSIYQRQGWNAWHNCYNKVK